MELTLFPNWRTGNFKVRKNFVLGQLFIGDPNFAPVWSQLLQFGRKSSDSVWYWLFTFVTKTGIKDQLFVADSNCGSVWPYHQWTTSHSRGTEGMGVVNFSHWEEWSVTLKNPSGVETFSLSPLILTTMWERFIAKREFQTEPKDLRSNRTSYEKTFAKFRISVKNCLKAKNTNLQAFLFAVRLFSKLNINFQTEPKHLRSNRKSYEKIYANSGSEWKVAPKANS